MLIDPILEARDSDRTSDADSYRDLDVSTALNGSSVGEEDLLVWDMEAIRFLAPVIDRFFVWDHLRPANLRQTEQSFAGM